VSEQPEQLQQSGTDAASPGASVPASIARFATGRAWLWLSLAVIALDQLTKQLVVERWMLFEKRTLLPILDFTRLHNTGAAFSFLAGASGWQRWFFIALGVVVSAGIIFWLGRLRLREQGLLAAGLALILGGALGNVIDRIWHGYVVDFIHFHWHEQWYFPAFNIADSAITIGAALLILDALLDSRRAKSVPPRNPAG
jgi:signal peptidase II